jgi:hypothetical protein
MESPAQGFESQSQEKQSDAQGNENPAQGNENIESIVFNSLWQILSPGGNYPPPSWGPILR